MIKSSTIWTPLENVPYGVDVSLQRKADGKIVVVSVGASVRVDGSVIGVKVKSEGNYNATLPKERVVNVNLEDRPLLPGSSLP